MSASSAADRRSLTSCHQNSPVMSGRVADLDDGNFEEYGCDVTHTSVKLAGNIEVETVLLRSHEMA